MAVHDILIHPDPRLKRVAAPVALVDDRVRGLAADMLETMYDAPGIGLAAPQLGIGVRMVVMDCIREEDAAPQPMTLINPRVTWASDETASREEGCLSIPDQYAEIERPAEVEVTWTDLGGEARAARFDGLWAVCVQHEIDHLDGVLFIDHLKPLKRQMITRRMVKLKREKARA